MTDPVRKLCTLEIQEKRKDGGRIIINTASVDRDRDRVFPSGARVDNYLKNPVVQWGHNYRDPWATVGKTLSLPTSAEGLVADFELRPAANDQDPQNIVRLLWEGEWIRTASIGFIPMAGKPNELGGTDFSEWELLEWSLVPIPSNQDALRLAMKGLDGPLPASFDLPLLTDLTTPPAYPRFVTLDRDTLESMARSAGLLDPTALQKRGRVLSAKNEERIVSARDALNEVLSQLETEPAAEDPADASKDDTRAPDNTLTVISAEDERDLAQRLRMLIDLVKGV